MTQDWAGIHDAELIGLDVNRNEKSVSLRFRYVDASVHLLQIEGVSAFRVTDFVGQNVTSRLLVSLRHVFSEDEVVYWVKWISSFTDTSSWATDKQIELIRGEIAEGALLLIVLEPSCGAEFAALARAYSLELIQS